MRSSSCRASSSCLASSSGFREMAVRSQSILCDPLVQVSHAPALHPGHFGVELALQRILEVDNLYKMGPGELCRQCLHCFLIFKGARTSGGRKAEVQVPGLGQESPVDVKNYSQFQFKTNQLLSGCPLTWAFPWESRFISLNSNDLPTSWPYSS